MAPRLAPRVVWCLLGFALGWLPSARAISSTSTSDTTTDPSCVTVQVAAASTAKSNSECPAVLMAVTLTASTDDCASDLEMLMVIEEYPRDLRTYGGQSSAALEDKSITWTAPSLSVGTTLSVEFRIDLCGYCDKYDGGRFNPIDSFQYDDAEGNEPNDRKIGYKLKLDCVGIEGDPVDTIVAIPQPTAAPYEEARATSVAATATSTSSLYSPAPTGAGATAAPLMTPAAADGTAAPAMTQAPIGATAAPGMTPAPATTPNPATTQAPAGGTAAPPAATQAPIGASDVPATTQAPAGASSSAAMTRAPARAPAPAMGGGGASGSLTTSSGEVPAESSEEDRRGSDDGDDDSGPSDDDDSDGGDDDVDDDGSASENAYTGAPTIAGTQGGSRAAFFSEAPTAAPTAAPTGSPGLGGDSSQGVTVEIQSIFEARRKALATDVSDHALERRALSVVYAEDADEYDDAMAGVCASIVGVSKESVIAVSTDFGPDGPAEDAARRGLMTSLSSAEEDAPTATQLTPITTCEVGLGGSGETRAMSAATLVDRMMEPDNFVLMLDENKFGPVNAAVSSVSFWQNECRDQTCPAAGDGSFASVFPVNDAENQRSVVGDDGWDEEQRIFWFAVLAAALLMAAVFSWCCFCLCCGGCSRRERNEPKRTLEDKYSVKSPPKGSPVVAALSPPRPIRQRSAEPPSHANDTPSGSLPGPSPTTPPPPRPRSQRQPSGRRRAPPPHLSMSPARISAAARSANAAGLAEPPSPGEADWRNKFGLGPLRDYAYRSAPVSPRRTPSSNSGGSTGPSSLGDPFCTTYRDNVVAAADGELGGKLRLPPLMDDATSAMESQSQSTWQMTDEINTNVQHVNDPVVRSSLGKAGMVIANALSSPRRELNRLKEALNRPARQGSCTATSPTATASSLDPSSASGFGGSEGGFSPQATLDSGSHFNSSSHFKNVSSPIYEIDLEADENCGPTAGNAGEPKERAAQNPATGASAAGDGPGDSSSHGASSGESTPSLSSRRPGRNMFAKAPGSTYHSRSGSSHGTPSSPSARPAVTDEPDTNADGNGPFSVLEKAAAAAEVKVGVQSPTGRAVQALANSSATGGSSDGYDGSVEGSMRSGGGGGGGGSGDGGSVEELPNMPPLPTDGGGSGRPEATRAVVVAAAAATPAAMSKGKSTKPDTDEGAGGTASPAPSPCGSPAAPFGGFLSGLGCMVPQITPRAASAPQQISPRAGSRLPKIDDMDLDGDDDMDLGEDEYDPVAIGEDGAPLLRPPPHPKTSAERLELVGEGAASASAPGMTLEAAIAKSRSHIMTPNLTPIAELAENDFFTDSEAESEVSSRASSVSSSRSRRRAPRDPAALLAAAMEKAGQVAAIPPPSAGSPGQVGRPLSAVQEVPMEAVPLPGLVNPDSNEISTPRQWTGGFQKGQSTSTSSTSTSTSSITLSPLPPSTQAPRTAKESVDVAAAAVPIPRPAQRPAGERSPSSEEDAEKARQGDAGAGAASPYLHPSPARSRQEEEDEEKEHKLWDEAVKEQKKAGAVEGGAPKLDSPSATPPAEALERAAAAAAAPDAPAARKPAPVKAREPQRPAGFTLEAPKLPGFSLMGALASFLGKKDTEPPGAPVVVAEEETEETEATVTINVPPELGAGFASDFTESPESHTLELWPDAIVEKLPSKPAKSSLDDGFVDVPIAEAVERQVKSSLDDGFVDAPMAAEVAQKPPKSSLDDGFVDAPIAEVAMATEVKEGPGEAAEFKLPGPGFSADLPALALPADEIDGVSKPDNRAFSRAFSRASMHLQSPGMDFPKGLDPGVAPSPTQSAVSAMKTPSTITNPGRMSDASPMYDRAAIAKAMSQAAEEADLDGESDIVMPTGAWPSERRQNSDTGSNSVMSDMTSSSSPSGGSGGSSSSSGSSGSSGLYTSSDSSNHPS